VKELSRGFSLLGLFRQEERLDDLAGVDAEDRCAITESLPTLSTPRKKWLATPGWR
jgi:hypothetical protein